MALSPRPFADSKIDESHTDSRNGLSNAYNALLTDSFVGFVIFQLTFGIAIAAAQFLQIFVILLLLVASEET